MDITLKIILPFHSFTFDDFYSENRTEIKFRNIEFNLKVTEFDEIKNYTDIRIEWKQSELNFEEITDSLKSKIVERGIDFINHLVYQARTFDLKTTNIVLVSPRTINSVLLKLEKDNRETEEEIKLVNNPPEFFQEYFELINDPMATDSFYFYLTKYDGEGVQSLEVNLLVDAYHAIYESRYSEAVINCLTAIEIHIHPLLSNWLTDKFLHKNEKNTEKVLLDMSSSTKYELLFGSVAEIYLSREIQLLEGVKGVNKLRNEIVHKGKRASKQEAINCLNVASKLILILFFKIEQDFLIDNNG